MEVPTTKRVPLFVDETHVGAPRPPANSEGKAELSLDLDCHTLGRAARAAKSSQAPLTRSLMICVFWGIGSSGAGQLSPLFWGGCHCTDLIHKPEGLRQTCKLLLWVHIVAGCCDLKLLKDAPVVEGTTLVGEALVYNCNVLGSGLDLMGGGGERWFLLCAAVALLLPHDLQALR